MPGANITDLEEDWTHNYRCPDVVVFLKEGRAINRETHFFGGPDFAVEIVSEFDRSREKLPFYARVGVRELLLVDRDPWVLELFRLQDDRLDAGRPLDPRESRRPGQHGLALVVRARPRRGPPEDRAEHADGIARWIL